MLNVRPSEPMYATPRRLSLKVRLFFHLYNHESHVECILVCFPRKSGSPNQRALIVYFSNGSFLYDQTLLVYVIIVSC